MRKGFSLLEVILALGIFFLVVYALYPIFFSIGKQIDGAKREDQLVAQARVIYEKRRAGLEVEDHYQIRGRTYTLSEKVIKEDDQFQSIQWTLRGGDYEKTWTGLVPKKSFYTP